MATDDDEMRLDDLLAYQLALGEDYEAFLSALLNAEDGQSLLRLEAEAWPAHYVAHAVEEEVVEVDEPVVLKKEERGSGAEAPGVGVGGGRAASPQLTVAAESCPTPPGASQLSTSQTALAPSCASASSGGRTACSVMTTPPEALIEVDGPAPPEPQQQLVVEAAPAATATTAVAAPPREEQQQQLDNVEMEEETEEGNLEEASSSGGGGGGVGHRMGHRRPSKLCRLCGATMLGAKCVGQDTRGRCKYVWERKGMAAFHECGVCWECRDKVVPGKGYVCTTNQHLTFAFKYTKDRATGQKQRQRKCLDCARRKKN